MNDTTTTCPICKGSQARLVSTNGQWLSFDCATCGRFDITGSAAAQFENDPPTQLFIAWLRNAHETVSEVVKITTDVRTSVEKSLSPKSWAQKQRLLLGALARKSRHPGDAVLVVASYDYPLSWSANAKEFEFVLQSLVERRWAAAKDAQRVREHFVHDVTVTPEGWDVLESEPNPATATQAFVAMSFHESLAAAWSEGIRPAIQAAGWDAFRVDQQPHADRIDVRIMAEIRRSRFVVADVTGQRPGVYFEAGYALGLGIPVIWSVRNDEAEQVHFDTRQYNHLYWVETCELRTKLEDFVRGIIGTGPKKSGT